MSEPDLAKKRGRPRAEQPMASVSAWVPASAHDRLIQLANQQEQSVSSLVKDLLLKAVRPGRA